MSLIFKPLFEKESSTYTYLLADSSTKEAIIIDAVDETQQRDIGLIEELGLDLKYIIETHVHADHITSSCPLKQKFVNAQIVLGKTNPVACADVLIKDQETLEFGDYQMTAMTTPGHTDLYVVWMQWNCLYLLKSMSPCQRIKCVALKF